MPDCHLIRTSTSPPGGFRLYLRDLEGLPIYITGVGGKKTDKLREFDSDTLVEQGVAFRHGNNLPGASPGEVLRDSLRDTCLDLGCDPRFCHDGSAIIHSSPTTTHRSERKGCAGCGRRGKF